LGRSVAEVYVGAFVVEAPLKELYALSKKPEIMVDTPLDLTWKYREEGKTVVVKRVTHGNRYLREKKNLCSR
jgi:predicted double-glycine peptidase